MRINRVKKLLSEGETVYGTMVVDSRSPGIAQIFAVAGFDFMFIDMEHSALSLGTVQEGRYAHKIMVPFGWTGEYKVSWIQEGTFTVQEVVARLEERTGQEREIRLAWIDRYEEEALPIVVRASTPGLKRVKLRFLDRNEAVLEERELEIDFRAPVKRGGFTVS